jgi:hypothetical protein
LRKRQVLDDAAADQMFLDDALQRLRPGRVVPHALGIDQCDGPSIANAETVGAGAIDAVDKAKLGQAAL